MEDIVPGLLAVLQQAFERNLSVDETAAKLLEHITHGRTNYADALDYAGQVGEALAKAFRENLNGAVLPDERMYWNIADRVVRTLLEQSYALVADAAVKVQESLNRAADIGLRARSAPLNEDKVYGIVNKIAEAERYEDVYWLLQEPVVNFCRTIVDDTLRVNAEFQSSVGLRPRIVRRTAGKCCQWCDRLAGSYDYPYDVPKEVYQRHEYCKCVVEYDPREGKRQNVHTKQWTSEEERATIEARKTLGIKSLPEELADHPARLSSYTPESLKETLEAEGFEVKPLKQGSLKNVAFENGGGYKVNFPDGGILQYHPDNGSHHGGAYYKISTGKGGRHRYGLNGEEKKD